MSEIIEQEGGFKVKVKKPRKKADADGTNAKADGAIEEGKDINKVELKDKKNAIQEQGTEGSVLGSGDEGQEGGENPKLGLQEMGEGNEEEIKITELVEPEKLIVEAERNLTVVDQPKDNLPENINKLVEFMNETGGSIEDYVRLNTNYDNIDATALLREYYRQTKPHMDREDVDMVLEDFYYDEEFDDAKEIRKKKLAFKEEVGKAKEFLEDLKSKYYEEIKARNKTVTQNSEAEKFFDRYKQDQQLIEQRRGEFQSNTNKLFGEDFKGFDFTVGEKKFKYNLKDPSQTAKNQMEIENVFKRFLNDKGEISDYNGYHKTLYVANNYDQLFNSFYEQGKADAIKEIAAKSNNIGNDVRQVQSGDVYVNGMKVKAVQGVDSTKLRVRKIN